MTSVTANGGVARNASISDYVSDFVEMSGII